MVFYRNEAILLMCISIHYSDTFKNGVLSMAVYINLFKKNNFLVFHDMDIS